MPFTRQATFDLLRSLGFASISATYAKLGSTFSHEARAITIINQTDGDIFVAVTNGATPASDGTADNLFIPNNTAFTYDVTTNNSNVPNSAPFVFGKNNQFWVRQSTAPSKLSVYLQILYGVGE